jgi:hypothetical protein
MDEGTNGKLKRLLLPGAASVLGTGVGLALTKADKLGIDDLADDLRSKLSSVTGNSSSGPDRSTASSGSRQTLDSKELAKRQRERQQRRKQRAGR